MGDRYIVLVDCTVSSLSLTAGQTVEHGVAGVNIPDLLRKGVPLAPYNAELTS